MAILLIRPSERQTRVGMHDRCIFISHSAHDDTWTTSVRHAVVDAIEGMSGYRALVDERVFAAGDLWRPLLYQWLAKADAAVLFLSEPALASAWVRKEATILSWRRELGSGVRIIPVLLGVRMKDVRDSWPAVEIHESHAVVVEPGTDPDGAAREILSHFADLGDADDAMRGWVARVAALLESAPDVYLRLGAVELGLDEDEWRLEGLCNAMGHALLHTDIERAERAVLQTADGLATRLKPLVGLVTPVCLPVDVAEPVSRAMQRPPGERVAVVPLRFRENGPRLADRATCSDRRVLRFEVPGAGVEDSAGRLYASLLQEMAAVLGVPPGDEVGPQDVERQGRMIALVRHAPDDGVTEEVLRRVVERARREFPSLTVVVLTGSNDAEAAERLAVPGAVIAPALAFEDERAGYMAAKRLLGRIG
jgi:hypothetical protein